MLSTNRSVFLGCVLAMGAAFTAPASAQLSVAPASPTALDLVRLRWTHVGCTNPDSVQVAMQANRVTVMADRAFAVDCGTVLGYFDEYTVGRLPAGEYDIELVANPPPPTLGPSQLIGPIHLIIGALPPTGALLPHDDYSGVWWNSTRPGQALTVLQSGDTLAAAWFVNDVSGNPVWYTLQPGPGTGWTRDAVKGLRYVGTVYKTTASYWGGPFNPALFTAAVVGTASFAPPGVSAALFEYTVEGISGSEALQRFNLR
jgi:hypothetical protein